VFFVFDFSMDILRVLRRQLLFVQSCGVSSAHDFEEEQKDYGVVPMFDMPIHLQPSTEISFLLLPTDHSKVAENVVLCDELKTQTKSSND
jgi:hypothetical protein